jgi:hypothetical protein
MTEFLRSIKSDLLSQRMLPLVVVLGVALLAAVGYAFTGSSGGSTPVLSAGLPSVPAGSAAARSGLSVATENPHVASSETPGGVRYQSQGPTRDPFIPLVSPSEAKNASSNVSPGSSGSKASSTSGSSGGSAGSSNGGTSTGGAGTGGKTTPTAPPAKQPPVYVVSAALTTGPASTTQPVVVTPYVGLKAKEPIPSKQDVRLTFERVTADGKGAVFKLVVAPILHGQGTCLPSASECESIDLAVGQVEELEYVEADGQTVVYTLKVVSINKVVVGANAARARTKAGAARLRRKAHSALAGRKARSAQAAHK